MCSIFKEWEQTVMNKQVGGESAIIKTVREVCKAFVPGVDNKNGASLELKTYLSRINVKFQLKAFQGNRFNIVFHNGGVIYYLHGHFIYFLENIKSEGNTNTLNMLMKDVLRNLKCSHNIVGLRALGVFNKFITTPLGKIIEADNTHILDMNAHYHNLIQFLEDVATNVESANELLTGERRPFPNIKIKKDEVWEVLVKQQTNDAETVSLLMQMAAATCKSLKEKVKDHLPGGKFENVTAEEQIQMKSVIPHNKLPEWVFGYLDWLLKHRPNSTRLANEAHIVYKLNKTSEWLHKKSELEIEKLVQWSKRMLPIIKFQEKERIKEIKKQMEDLSKAKEEKSKTKKAKQQEEKRELLDAIFVQGLWKSRQEIKMKLQQKSKTQKRKMLTNQINFRQLIVEQSSDKKTFQISRIEGKPVTVDMLMSNLEILIRLENVSGKSLFIQLIKQIH
ncbi:uncharacterized protein LOC127713901 [Mytilus californianus]|uniref:uncharacterized protein LOC127713901 n=1 Tax=Mytilus californianus TaxID=6549 RepID=UPI0022484D3C|nr:uncharacterized protein LOC127713901 [Mytilus californianus]